MRDRELYAKLLGIEAPWLVEDVDARLEELVEEGAHVRIPAIRIRL